MSTYEEWRVTGTYVECLPIRTGTSAYDGDGGWDDPGFIYEQRGWLPRRHLAEMCRLLEARDEPAVWDLLEPFEDGMEVRRG